MGSSSRSKTILHSPLGNRRSLACVCGGPCQYQKQTTNAASGPLGVYLRASTIVPVNYYKMAVQKNRAPNKQPWRWNSGQNAKSATLPCPRTALHLFVRTNAHFAKIARKRCILVARTAGAN